MISLSKFNLKPQARDLSPAWVLCIIGIIPYKAPLKGLAGVAVLDGVQLFHAKLSCQTIGEANPPSAPERGAAAAAAEGCGRHLRF